MPTSAAVAYGLLPATISGTVDLTVSGFGTPSAAIFFVSQAGTNNPQNAGAFGVGFYDGTNQRAIGLDSENGVSTSNTSRGNSATDVIAIPNHDASDLYIRASASTITDGIRLTVSEDNTPVEREVVAVLFSGLLNAYVGTHTFTNTTSPQDITAPGFKPDLVFSLFQLYTFAAEFTNNAVLSFGVAHNNSVDTITQMCLSVSSEDAQTTSDTETYIDDGNIIAGLFNGSVVRTAAVSDFDTSGFSITTSDANTQAMYYMALELNNPDDAYLAIKDSAVSTGNQAYTGAGFAPSCLLLLQGLVSAVDTVTNGAAITIGAADSSTQASVDYTDENGQTTTDTDSQYSLANIYSQRFNDGTTDGVAALSSFDSDGWTLNYSDASASARKMIALAIGDSTAGGGTVTGSVPDSLTITDTTTNTATIVALASDSLALSDTSSVVGTFVGTVSDSIVVTDEATGDLAGAITGAVPDAMSFTDTAAVTVNFVATASDSLGLTDTSSNTANRVAASDDSLALTDLIDLTQALNVAVNDLLNLAETLTGGEVGEKVYCAYYTFMSSAETAVIAELNADDLIREAGLTDELAAYGFMSDSDTVRIAAISAADTVVAATLLC